MTGTSRDASARHAPRAGAALRSAPDGTADPAPSRMVVPVTSVRSAAGDDVEPRRINGTFPRSHLFRFLCDHPIAIAVGSGGGKWGPPTATKRLRTNL